MTVIHPVSLSRFDLSANCCSNKLTYYVDDVSFSDNLLQLSLVDDRDNMAASFLEGLKKSTEFELSYICHDSHPTGIRRVVEITRNPHAEMQVSFSPLSRSKYNNSPRIYITLVTTGFTMVDTMHGHSELHTTIP